MNYADELDIILEQDQHLAHAVAANPKATNFLEFLGQQADFTAGMLRYLNQFPEIHQQLEDLPARISISSHYGLYQLITYINYIVHR